MTLRGTSSTDIVDNPVIYQRMGVQEYFLYDPTASYLEPPLQGYRMANGTLREIAKNDRRLRRETLGVELFLREDDLVIVDTETGVQQVTKAEAEEFAREQVLRMREPEREVRLIAERRVRELEEKPRRLEGGNRRESGYPGVEIDARCQ